MNDINVTNSKLPRSIPRRLGMLILALCMALSLLPIPPANAAFSDAAMDKLLNWGVVSGYPDGALHPDWSLTRAEFVAMVNRAYGYRELGNTPFIDVPNNAWFRDDINIGYNANYFTGVSPRMAGPDQELTREQAMVLLARNMRMKPADGEVIGFTDGRDFSDWSRGYARAAKEAGIIGGYGDGSYKPKNKITRGEMAVMLQRALGTLINKPGTHTLSDVYGNVTISSPNVILRNSTIAGDLYITGGLSLGDVTLENVRVLGNIIIAGGGESESGESVILRNVQADSLIVDSIAGQYLSLAAEGDTMIAETILRTSAYVQDRTRPGGGLLQITLDSLQQNPVFTLSGNLETVVNKTPASALNIAMGTVDVLTIDEEARGSTLNLDINSTVKELNLDTGITVTGVGDIGDLFVNAPGASVEMLPDTVTIRPGLTADIAGQTMNAQQAQESSSDPRLHAGYPKVKNIAPTNATSVYSANKGGTVYWAVSNTVDGSIGEEDLIEPTTDNTRIELSGTTAIGQSNTEYTAALEKLIPDSNYYLSTVMVDARGRRSPLKVASFATPDNTVPAFAQGYPTVMKNYSESVMGTIELNGAPVTVVQRDEDGYPLRNYRAQIAAMPNKSCVLYYALYPAGSTAPTAQQFRTGALGSPIRSGMEDASKNRINFIELTGLEELTNYDVYLCYIDADGSRSSPVQKLTFRTVDGKPPRFQFETPVVTQEQLTSLRLSVNVDENATVYWVASRGQYVNDGPWDDVEWWERACRQIESGTNGIRSGSVNARANTDAIVNITGLQPATRYYITFVAKDAAGNYSEFFRLVNTGSEYDEKHPELYTPHNQQPYRYYLIASTLDNIPPTATQEFTSYDAVDPNRPYADTDILIHFSEAVMQYSTNASSSQDKFRDFDTLYKALVSAREELKKAQSGNSSQEEIKTRQDNLNIAETAFVNALRATIKLYNNASSSNSSVKERDSLNAGTVGDDWVIDYRYAVVETDADTGEMTVRFPTNSENPGESALNLASGATYHFVLEDICDTSSNKNRMGRYPLPDFTTISAQVKISWFDPSYVYYTNYYKTGADTAPQRERVTIDAAFSLTPLSTSVEDNIVWDLILWADASCRIEVYELESGTIGSDAVLVRPLDSSGRFSAVDNGHFDVEINQATLGNSNPDPAANDYTGYRGVSYFADFYGVNLQTSPSDGFPSVTGSGALLDRYTPGMDYTATLDINPRGILERLKPKYYGIHFTEVERSNEKDGGRDSWNASFNLRASVVTAPLNNSLRILSQGIDASSLNTFLTQNGGSVIQVDQPSYTPIQFTSGVAPEFATRYPQFAPEDTSVDLRITLKNNRVGTVYYVIAPASRWITNPITGLSERIYEKAINDTTAYKEGSTTGVALHDPSDDERDPWYERYYAVLDDVVRYVPTGGDDDTVDDTTFLLAHPTNYGVYAANYNNSRIKVGSIPITDASMVEWPIEGLEADTVYFAYLVTKGTGGTDFAEYAQLYQFTTKELNPPRLTVTQPGDDYAIISTDKADTEVYAAMFESSMLDNLPVFTDPFFYRSDGTSTSDYINPDRAQYMSSLQGMTDSSGTPYLSYTVWEAIRAEIPPGLKLASGGSLFDFFATERVKDMVASLIRSRDENAQGAQFRGPVTISPPETWTPDFTLGDPPLAYIVFAVGGLRGSSGHSLSFGAAGLLRKPDNSKPTIQSITGSMTVDYKNTTAGNPFIMYGYITLTFDQDLYLFDPSANAGLGKQEALTGTTVASSFITDSDEDSRGKAFISAEQIGTGPVRTVRIRTRIQADGGILDGNGFTVNAQLCTPAGIPRNTSLRIVLDYDEEANKLYARVVNDGPDWFPRGNGVAEIPMSPTTPILPDATGWQLNTTYLNLTIGGSGQIEVRTTPERANGTFTYSSSDGTVATVDGNGVVSGLKEGDAEITVRFFVGSNELFPLGWATAGKVTVHVTADATIVLSKRTMDLRTSNTDTIQVTVNADSRVNKKVTYRFNDAGYYGPGNTSEKLVLDVFQQLGDSTTVYQVTVSKNYTLTSYEPAIIITFYLVDYPSVQDSVSVTIPTAP